MMSVKFGLGEDADIIDEKDGKIDSDNDDRSEDSDSSSNEDGGESNSDTETEEENEAGSNKSERSRSRSLSSRLGPVPGRFAGRHTWVRSILDELGERPCIGKRRIGAIGVQ
eukprot:FR741022.1.p3 GENE.FR741022.1~~FR741022.1.p3  ORF type:complete len:112 (+),score=13.55 FR741022.1:512-847(+)